MALWRKPLQFINVMLANRSPMSVAERGPGRMTYAKKKNPLQNTTCASRLSAQVMSCSYYTRNTHAFCLPFCRINIKQFSVFYQGPKCYNSPDTYIVNSTSPASFTVKPDVLFRATLQTSAAMLVFWSAVCSEQFATGSHNLLAKVANLLV